MHPVTLLIIACGNLTLGIVAWLYFKKFQQASLEHNLEAEKKERELKRKILELQVLRSLGERVGYSLDLRQILEVIIDSLAGLVDFETISYMLIGAEGRIVLKIHVASPISRQFLADAKTQMLTSLSAMTGYNLQPALIDETLSGNVLDDTQGQLGALQSFFNLPLSVGGQVAALINVSSSQKGLYGDEETAILYTILNQVSAQASKLSQVVENEKRKLAAMVSSFVDGVAMVDPNFNLLVANSALLKLLKFDHPINLYDIVAGVGTNANLEDALKQALGSQTLIKLSEFSLNDRVIQIDVEPVKDRFGYLLGAALVFHDITARKQLESLREEFTAMMVHELRTPLTTIAYGTSMVLTDLSKLSPEEVSQNLKTISSTASQMLSLVNELLDVAKIEAGKFTVIKQEENLKSLIEDKINTFKPLADQKQLKLSSEIDPSLPAFSFDKVRLGQVMDNLLSNAVKYTSHGGVNIKVGQNNNQIAISVIDTGEGIASSDIPKLFSKFDQLGKGKTREITGTGLGLVIAKGIIEAHGGTIWASSEGLGKGTTFTFTIPIGN